MDEEKIRHIPLNDVLPIQPTISSKSLTKNHVLPFDWQIIYKYYLHHGFQIYLMKQLFNLLILIFITIISFYLFAIDWYNLLSCPESHCYNLYNYTNVNISDNIWSIFFIGNLTTLILTILLITVLSLYEIRQMYHFRIFLLNKNLNDQDLIFLSWKDFLIRLNTVYNFYNEDKSVMIVEPINTVSIILDHRTGSFDHLVDQIHGSTIDPESNDLLIKYNDNIHSDNQNLNNQVNLVDITTNPNAYIQRVNNSIINMFTHHTYDYSCNYSCNCRASDNIYQNDQSNSAIYSNVMYWVLTIILSDLDLLNRLSKLERTKILNRRIKVYGYIILSVYPFLLITSILYVILKHSEQLHAKNYLGPRIWTAEARYKFQRINELPHEFEAKLQNACQYVENYLDQFPNYSLQELCKFIRFVSASLLTILSSIAIYNENIILNVTFIQRNLVFYLAVLTIIFYTFSYTYSYTKFEPEVYMQKLLQSLGYDETRPEKAETIILSRYLYWQTRAKSHEVKKEVSALFKYKIVNLLSELYAILQLPYILLCKFKFTI